MINQSLMDTRVPAIKRVNGADITPAGGPYGLLSADAYVVLTPEPVLVDCGGPPTYGQLRDNLAVLGVTPADVRLVIATHFHGDHVGNVRALRQDAPRISFAIHEADAASFVESRPPRRRGIEAAEVREIVVAQQGMTAAQRLTTPETWISEFAVQKARELGWRL